MPYSHISSTRDGHSAIKYALEGSAHNDSDAPRNELVTTVGFLPGVDYHKQCEELWKHASSKNKIRMRRIVLSFSSYELPNDDENSFVKAADIAQTMVEEYYPDHPFLICVQCDADSENPKVHVHLLSPNVSMKGYKGFNDDQTSHWYLRKALDDTCEKLGYFELDNGQHSFEKISRTERRKRWENEHNMHENERIKEENKVIEFMNRSKSDDEKTPLKEYKPISYIWKDDLKGRVLSSMKGSKSHDDFLERLEYQGVKGTFKNTKKQGDFILYELTDKSRFPEGQKIPETPLKAKSYKLGYGYGIEALDLEIQGRGLTAQTVKSSEPTHVDDEPDVKHKNPFQGQIDALKKKTDEMYDYYDKQVRDYDRDSRPFFRWCIENDIEYGQGASFDEKKFAAAKRKYKKHLEEQERLAYIESLKEQGIYEEEPDDASPIPVPVSEDEIEEEAEEEISDDDMFTDYDIIEEPDDFEPDLSDLEDEVDEDIDLEVTPKRSAKVQAMIDALNADAENVIGNGGLDDDFEKH